MRGRLGTIAYFYEGEKAPRSSFKVDGTFGSFSFTDTSVRNPTSWEWDFGDGNTSSLQNPIHSFSNLLPGSTVGLTVSNSVGSDYSSLYLANPIGGVDLSLGRMKTSFSPVGSSEMWISFGGWFKIKEFSNSFLYGRSNTSTSAFYIRMYSTGEFGISTRDGSGNVVDHKTSTTYSTDQWYYLHCQITYNGSTKKGSMSLFINRDLVVSSVTNEVNLGFGHLISIGGSTEYLTSTLLEPGFVDGKFYVDELYFDEKSWATIWEQYAYYNYRVDIEYGIGRSKTSWSDTGSGLPPDYTDYESDCWWGFNDPDDLGNGTGDRYPTIDLTIEGTVSSIDGLIKED